MMRILLVDDHASSRQALALLLEREQDVTVAGQAGSLAEARQVLPGARADVAVVDLKLPDGDGVTLVGEMRAAKPNALVLVLTASNERTDYARAVDAGASGVLPKTAPLSEVLSAIRRLGAGEPVLPPHEVIDLLRLAGRTREQDYAARLLLNRLTPRESEVLQALADGLSDKEIAERLTVSTKTVRSHMVNILRKLEVDSRLQALLFAVRYGAVELG
jgi:DNA-binding NarL/FixJ family response regulator